MLQNKRTRSRVMFWGSVEGSEESREPKRSRANRLLKLKCMELHSKVCHKRPQARQPSQELSLGVSGPGAGSKMGLGG